MQQTRQRLIDIHRASGLTAREFAESLDFNVSAWHNIVAGRRGVPLSLVKQAVKVYPELESAILADLGFSKEGAT
jgi:hypothetical protein